MCGALSPPFDSGVHFLQLRYEALPLWHARVFSSLLPTPPAGALAPGCAAPARRG